MIPAIADVEVANKTVLIRVDLNVPLVQGRITNQARLLRLVPGVRALLTRGARLVLLSHLGRPKGQVVAGLSLAPIAAALGDLLGHRVGFCAQVRGPEVARAVANLQAGQALVLENVRFEPGEEANDLALARDWAALGDLYVNDAFSAAHRAHASTAALAGLLPAYAGALMTAELTALDAALSQPERPVMALVGGAKVSTKFDLLFNLLTKVDVLVIGGAMANTFLMATGVDVGGSLHEPDLAGRAREVLDRAQGLGCEVILPLDGVAAPGLDQGAAAQTVDLSGLGADQMMLDFGPRSVAAILAALPKVKTLIWNGPLGAFEYAPFAGATRAVAAAVAAQTQAGKLLSVAGGGDTVAALEGAGVLPNLTYVSTAGGAFLEWMEGRELPGLAALEP